MQHQKGGRGCVSYTELPYSFSSKTVFCFSRITPNIDLNQSFELEVSPSKRNPINLDSSILFTDLDVWFVLEGKSHLIVKEILKP